MKLPDLPRPQAPGASAVDRNAVARIEASTKQRLSAANQIGDSLRSEYGAAMEARDRADRTEAKTRSILYKNKLDKLLTEEVERMNSMPLDYPVGDLQEEFTAKQEELRLSELGGVNERVSRYMHDNMLLADSEAGLQATVAVRNQLNARTFHFTTVAHNSVSNEIYDVANDTLYEDQTQVMASEVKANLAGLDAEFRAKYLRDMYDDYTKSHVWGMVKQNRIHEALRFLDKDQRADDRLYDKNGLRSQIQRLGEERGENAKTMINYQYDEFSRYLAVNSERAADVFPILNNLVANYSPFTEEQRQWKQVMQTRVADLQAWADFRAEHIPADLNTLTNSQLDAVGAGMEDVNKRGSGVQAEQAAKVAKEAARIRTERAQDYAKYATENIPPVQASYGKFNQQFMEAIKSDTPEGYEQAARSYEEYRKNVRESAAYTGQEPYLGSYAEFETLPGDSPIGQLAADWMDDTTGPQMTVARIAIISKIFGKADSIGIFQKSRTPNNMLAIAGSDTPIRTAQGLNLNAGVAPAEIAKSALQFYYNAGPPYAHAGAEKLQIEAEYKMLAQKAGILDRTIVDPALMEQAVYSVTGLMPPTGVNSLNPVGVRAYVHNGKMIPKGEFQHRVRTLFSKYGSDWSQYREDGFEGVGGPYRAGAGGLWKLDPADLRGKSYLRETDKPGVYFVMTKGSGKGGEDGFVLNSEGGPLRLDIRKVTFQPTAPVPPPEQLELRDIASGAFEPQP